MDSLTDPQRSLFARMATLGAQFSPRSLPSGFRPLSPPFSDTAPRSLPSIEGGSTDAPRQEAEPSTGSDAPESTSTKRRPRVTESDDDEGSTDSDEPRRKKRRPYHQMDKMTKSIDLDPHIRDFFRANNNDPEAFFSDPNAERLEPAGRRLLTQKRKGHLGEYISYQTEEIEREEQRTTLDKVRTLYGWLNSYDSFKKAIRFCKYEWGGAKFGSKVRAHILQHPDLLGGIQYSNDKRASDEKRLEVLNNFERNVALGKKIDLFCRQLGDTFPLRFAPLLDAHL